MATLVLGAVGASLGGSIGGSVLGLSTAVIGRAAGAAVGRVIDQTVLGRGAEAVEHGRVDRFRLTGASEGTPIARAIGRVRLGGQVIWATRFREHRKTTGGRGGKGAPNAPDTTTYSYTVSLALALCEGEILRVGRIWADGSEIARNSIQIRIHSGSEDQLPDSLIEAIDGEAPAYRGTAYVVIEDLDLTAFGNRIPQFSFEVVRMIEADGQLPAPALTTRGVAIVPGTGEYALSTTSVHYDYGDSRDAANVNTVQARSDFSVAVRDMVEELPNLKSTSIVVSWFGNDLRCGECELRPKVEQTKFDGKPQPWIVSGLQRKDALTVPKKNGRPVYGGTPSDISVIQAIKTMKRRGIDITFYPFILMEQMAGNAQPDPWGGDEQPVLPWRGRITTSIAPSLSGTTDGTDAARVEVKAFFGSADAKDFSVEKINDEEVRIKGPDEWSYRRFILHYAKLCAAAGGVEAFCIGSEMRSLTQIRGRENTFPAVAELKALAAEVRKILPHCKIGYAADWSEYQGYVPADTGDLLYNLDPLWSDSNIDFIGIDNYMPLSDWRDAKDHLDQQWGSCKNVDYLKANIEGGEGFHWFYPSSDERDAQQRIPISDGHYGEPWVWRYKDIRSWWSTTHHERKNGYRNPEPTSWVPGSKPIRFTEYGCAAIDKGSNQPNKFVDPKSSESSLPWYSDGRRDDAMQMAYLQAMNAYWADKSNNPVSEYYGDRMIDMDHSFVWAWDARPYPAFPELKDYWTDGENHPRGHWLSGRSAAQPLACVIAAICEGAGLPNVDVSRVFGLVRGYVLTGMQSARADLQPLLMAHGVEAVERDGTLVFSMRELAEITDISSNTLVRRGDKVLELQRQPEPEIAGRVLVHHVDAEGGFEARVSDAADELGMAVPVTETDLPLTLTRGEGHGLAERFLAESRIARDSVELTLAPSAREVSAGDILRIDGSGETWRIDRVDDAIGRRISATRTDLSVFIASDSVEEASSRVRPVAPLPVDAVILDLPLLTGDEVVHAPYVAISGRPWPGAVAVQMSAHDAGYSTNLLIDSPSVIGSTETVLPYAPSGRWDHGEELRVRLTSGSLSSASPAAVLAGANLLAIGGDEIDGWEMFQFQSARLIEPNVWGVSTRLRGQRGTDGNVRDPWPIGSRVVVLDGMPEQLRLPSAALGTERHLRFGPAALPIDHEAYRHRVIVPRGEGLRPYAPAHLRFTVDAHGVDARWIRRSRIPHESWEAGEVPLGEAREAYLVEVRDALGKVLQGTATDRPTWHASRQDWEQWRAAGARALAVAQVSETFGPGHFAQIKIG